MTGSYFFMGSNLDKCENFWKISWVSVWVQLDQGKTARADITGLVPLYWFW